MTGSPGASSMSHLCKEHCLHTMRCSEESLVPNQMDSVQPFHEWPLGEDGEAFPRWAQQYGSEARVLRVSLTRGCLWPLWNPSPPFPFLAEIFFGSQVGLTRCGFRCGSERLESIGVSHLRDL